MTTITVSSRPPSQSRETVALPGARGGSNWGGTASDPSKGFVYLLTQDWPSFVPIVAERRLPSSNGRYGASATGKTIYNTNCQMCHGAGRQGGGEAPSLVDIDARFNLDEFKQVLYTGRGDMPAFPSLSEANKDAIYAFLLNPEGITRPSRAPEKAAALGGPVVASGGAPGGLVVAPSSGVSSSGGFAGPPYPAGVTAPKRLYTDYGLDYPWVVSPPWSSLVAYDLNAGTIRWKVPIGVDPELDAKGIKDTGVPEGGERRGLVVTSTGLLFLNTRDSHIRAYDADNGRELWSAKLPSGTEGLPSLYQVQGREYLVVPAASPGACRPWDSHHLRQLCRSRLRRVRLTDEVGLPPLGTNASFVAYARALHHRPAWHGSARGTGTIRRRPSSLEAGKPSKPLALAAICTATVTCTTLNEQRLEKNLDQPLPLLLRTSLQLT